MPDPKRYDEFAELVRLHTNQVLAYIRVLLLNWHDAEDLFQETCALLWQKFDEFESGTNFLAWALRVADHKAMDFQKSRMRRIAFTASLRETLSQEIADRTVDETDSSLTALRGCMDKLTQNDREVVWLCYGDRVPVREVASAMGRSPQSVHNSLRRIREWLLGCTHRELRRMDSQAATACGSGNKEDGR